MADTDNSTIIAQQREHLALLQVQHDKNIKKMQQSVVYQPIDIQNNLNHLTDALDKGSTLSDDMLEIIVLKINSEFLLATELETIRQKMPNAVPLGVLSDGDLLINFENKKPIVNYSQRVNNMITHNKNLAQNGFHLDIHINQCINNGITDESKGDISFRVYGNNGELLPSLAFDLPTKMWQAAFVNKFTMPVNTLALSDVLADPISLSGCPDGLKELITELNQKQPLIFVNTIDNGKIDPDTLPHLTVDDPKKNMILYNPASTKTVNIQQSVNEIIKEKPDIYSKVLDECLFTHGEPLLHREDVMKINQMVYDFISEHHRKKPDNKNKVIESALNTIADRITAIVGATYNLNAPTEMKENIKRQLNHHLDVNGSTEYATKMIFTDLNQAIRLDFDKPTEQPEINPTLDNNDLKNKATSPRL